MAAENCDQACTALEAITRQPVIAPIPGLGLFSRLPYEIRELIWLGFFPVDQEDESAPSQSEYVDLRVLLTSRMLYREISDIIFSKTRMIIDLSPPPDSGKEFWATLRLRMRVRNGLFYDGPAWRLKCRGKSREHHFDHFPFCKLAAIDIHISNPEDNNRFFWRWRNVIWTLEVLESSLLPPVVIQLQKGKELSLHDTYVDCAGYNLNDPQVLEEVKYKKRMMISWVDTCYGIYPYPAGGYNSDGQYIYDILVLPFYSRLQGASSIRVEVHSQEIRQKMNWTAIRIAHRAFYRRVDGVDPFASYLDEEWINSRIISQYLYIHDCLLWETLLGKGETISYFLTGWHDQSPKIIAHKLAENVTRFLD
ncbi:hypothetical protein TESG_02783 [Trichophyton tonsurans CBS 112818]|uniref:F-box domain-containing protein n=1 Tax=Trichophyton tonsurans (strain CBS 112818) TaxID=647933 RepID=F2RVE6_TRIT1|nr:hypothetical protein TESG_02783 [Trichophyton tonsurans CBS 112818]